MTTWSVAYNSGAGPSTDGFVVMWRTAEYSLIVLDALSLFAFRPKPFKYFASNLRQRLATIAFSADDNAKVPVSTAS